MTILIEIRRVRAYTHGIIYKVEGGHSWDLSPVTTAIEIHRDCKGFYVHPYNPEQCIPSQIRVFGLLN